MKTLIISCLFVFTVFGESSTIFSFKSHEEASKISPKSKNRNKSYNKNRNKYLPSKSKRDSFIKLAKLEVESNTLDQFEKDLLYMRIKDYQVKYLTEKYPSIDVTKLKNAKKVMKDFE